MGPAGRADTAPGRRQGSASEPSPRPTPGPCVRPEGASLRGTLGPQALCAFPMLPPPEEASLALSGVPGLEGEEKPRGSCRPAPKEAVEYRGGSTMNSRCICTRQRMGDGTSPDWLTHCGPSFGRQRPFGCQQGDRMQRMVPPADTLLTSLATSRSSSRPLVQSQPARWQKPHVSTAECLGRMAMPGAGATWHSGGTQGKPGGRRMAT